MDEHDKKNLAEILFRASPVTLTSSVLALRSEVLQFYEHREMATRFTNQTTLHAFMSVLNYWQYWQWKSMSTMFYMFIKYSKM